LLTKDTSEKIVIAEEVKVTHKNKNRLQ